MSAAMIRAMPRAQLGLLKPQSFTTSFSRRWNSTNPSSAKPVSPHVGFYKTFTRPIAKVLLMATFTYQLAYWGWVKLETDEIKQGKYEVKVLEDQLEKLTKKEDGTKP